MSRRSLSDFPPPSRRDPGAKIRVVTIGGGHGQAALLRAITQLECNITAVVSVADDGGCSGRLREEVGMPPPGDIRRCLVALSSRAELASRFEERLEAGDEVSTNGVARSVGNLVLAQMFHDLGGLQLAVDWAAALLGCTGRVVPVAETAGVLRVYDLEHGALSGESYIESRSASPIVVNVEGPESANPEAKRAIMEADLVFIGPGSFVGSTLAALTTGDLARSLVATRAQRVLVNNLEREGSASFGIDEHERILRDHILIKSGGDTAPIDALSHIRRGHRADARSDGSVEYGSCLARSGERGHDEALLRESLIKHFGLVPSTPSAPLEVDAAADVLFEEALASARRRLFDR